MNRAASEETTSNNCNKELEELKSYKYQPFAQIKWTFEGNYNSSVKFSDVHKNNQFSRLQYWRQNTLGKDRLAQN